jgi:hypothetical protein
VLASLGDVVRREREITEAGASQSAISEGRARLWLTVMLVSADQRAERRAPVVERRPSGHEDASAVHPSVLEIAEDSEVAG